MGESLTFVVTTEFPTVSYAAIGGGRKVGWCRVDSNLEQGCFTWAFDGIAGLEGHGFWLVFILPLLTRSNPCSTASAGNSPTRD